MKIQLLMAALVSLVAASAVAAPDLELTLSGPTGLDVYEEGKYVVEVTNIGDQKAKNVTVVIDLPETANAPVTYAMGYLGDINRKCTASGTTVTCNLKGMIAGKTKKAWFKFATALSSAPVEFTATVTTTSADADPLNDTDSLTPLFLTYDIAVNAPATASWSRCSGTDLTSFIECVLAPTSIVTDPMDFHADGTVSFPTGPTTAGGTWSQPTPDSLVVELTNGGAPAASFVGFGANANCFEGVATFPNSAPWTAPYEICF